MSDNRHVNDAGPTATTLAPGQGRRRGRTAGYAWALILSAAATAIGWPLLHRLGLANTNVLMLYLLVVLWIAYRYTRGAAIFASVLDVALFDLFFVEPYYRFSIADPQYLVTFAAMLITALLISTLTHRVRTKAEEARLAWEKVETEFLRNTLLSGVSHELRTPVAGIMGAVTTLMQTKPALSHQASEEMLATILAETDRMERLINNLLDMTRMESGGLALKKEWQPIHEVVGTSLNQLNRRLDGREVITHLPPDLPLVQIDSVAIEQVLSNLIDNAVEYTPSRSSIEIGASAGDGALIVQVADRGPGLPAGTEARVFEKFFRIRSTTENRRGIGLGLALARGIVEAHGGKITAANRPGGGAVFQFTLPLSAHPPRVDLSE